MEKIEKLDSSGFTDYLKQYQNTICGRYPISLLLHVSTVFTSRSLHVRVKDYLKQYQTTICGRYPISLLLHVSTVKPAVAATSIKRDPPLSGHFRAP